MHPVTHLLAGWTVASAAKLSHRDRVVVGIVAVVPDMDGLGFPVEFATRNSADPLLWYSDYHHVLGHNIGLALFCCGIALVIADRRWTAGLLTFLSFHTHLLGDLAGSRAADGYQWPIPYLEPFSDAWQLTWSGQWGLSTWPNTAISIALMGLVVYLAWWRGHSPLSLFSRRADRVFVTTLRCRFGNPDAQ
ncbi:MAG: metal-dependent hydrolase [Gemmatimonadetes bacterium]|nr:metal-dependent hydrolase [Gemmatimonadota bacterium]